MKLAKWAQQRAGWLRQHGLPIAITGAVVVVTLAAKPLLWPDGLGFRAEQSVTTTVETVTKDAQGNPIKTVTITKDEPGKTLWDWLSLLGVPLSLAVLGYWLQQEQQKRTEALAEEQRRRDQALTEEQRRRDEAEAREEALQVFFDRISVLLVDKNLLAIATKIDKYKHATSALSDIEAAHSGKPTEADKELIDAATDVIRARTLSILRRFGDDYKRKTSVVRFLLETELVSKLELDLGGSDLSGTDLQRTYLRNVKLRGSDLSGTDLSEACLIGADLREADLSGANLSGADLLNACLNDANLREADLSGANLSGADLLNAHMRGLRRDGLSNASIELLSSNPPRIDVKGADLRNTTLSGADLSKISFDSSTHWPSLEEVTKAKNIPDDLKQQLGLT